MKQKTTEQPPGKKRAEPVRKAWEDCRRLLDSLKELGDSGPFKEDEAESVSAMTREVRIIEWKLKELENIARFDLNDKDYYS